VTTAQRTGMLAPTLPAAADPTTGRRPARRERRPDHTV
jgi:hypothetical protein